MHIVKKRSDDWFLMVAEARKDGDCSSIGRLKEGRKKANAKYTTERCHCAVKSRPSPPWFLAGP